VKVDVAIVGNGVAGYACAARLARHGIRPLLVGPGLPVDRPPLTKNALAEGAPRLLADAARLAELGVELLDAFVDDADLHARTIVAGGNEVEADAVVLATGLSYRPPRLPGMEHAYVNATPGGMTKLATALRDGPRRVGVIGGGFLGVETAATLATLGHAVVVLDLLECPLGTLHDPLPALAEATLRTLGVRFVGGAPVAGVTASGGLVTISYEGGSVDVDAVVAATGGRPAPVPGLDADLPVLVDADMRVPGLDSVHAVGDAVRVPHVRFGEIAFPHWDMAIGTGERAADAIAGVAGELDRLPYWWSDIGPRRVAEVGWADAAVAWSDENGLHVGRDATGEPVAVLVVDEPRRLREARALLAQ
jgi:3-phenylpropionate/trans-cinnamate dioxygenase ferredoxin reductase subunit